MDQLQSAPASLESLPDALLFEILSRLTPDEVASKVLPLSRLLRTQAENPLLWQHFCGGPSSGLTEGDAAEKGGWKDLFAKVYRTNLICCPHFELLDRVEKEQVMDNLQPFDPVRLPRLLNANPDAQGSGWYLHSRRELDNPEGDNGADPFWLDRDCGWTPWSFFTTVSGGKIIARELRPVGCPPCPAAPGAPVLVTCHHFGVATQSVGFKNFPLAFLESCPAILMSAWYAGRDDCPSSFSLRALLRREGGEVQSWAAKDPVNRRGNSEHIQCPQGGWAKVEKLIVGYKGVVDKIRLTLSGADDRGWAGWYGAKFTAITLRFVPPGEVHKYRDSQ